MRIMKKIQVDENRCKYILFRIVFILVSVFQQQKLMKKEILTETFFLRKKDNKHQKKLGCKFIRINTSNPKNGYDLDYEVCNVQAFIDEFKNKKIEK